MKKINLFSIAIIMVAVGISCTDESKYPLPFDEINNANAGTLKIISQTTAFITTDIGNSKYQVTFEANDRDRGKSFEKVELYVSFVDQTDNGVGGDRAEKLLHTYQASEFTADPTTGLPRIVMSHTAAEVMTLLGLTLPEIVDGKDQLIFRQAMYLPGNKVYTSNNVSTAIATSGGVYKSPFQNVVTIFVCASALDGEVSYVNVVQGAAVPIAPCLPSISGTTEFSKISHGLYGLGDATFGQYDCAWNDKPATGVTWEDFCNEITTGGADQYGLEYGYALVSNDGTNLVLDWFNDYGDFGRVTLTRAGGWPTLIFLP